MDYGVAQGLIDGIVSVLPKSPFSGVIAGLEGVQEGLGWLNYFFPVGDVLTLLTAWCYAIALYYVYSVIMRWVKLTG